MKKLIAGFTTVLLAIGLALVAVAAPAFAHANVVNGSYVCNTDTGKFDITWTVANDYNLTETITASNNAAVPVNTVIAASPGQPYSTFTGTQTGVNAGSYTLTVTGKWSDNFSKSDSKTINVSGNCSSTVADAAAGVHVTSATCTTAAQLVYDTLTHAAYFSGTADGTFGPNSGSPSNYSVTFKATSGHTFVGGSTTKTFTGKLAAPTGGEDCTTKVTVSVVISATPPTCYANGTLVIPAQTGVVFSGGSNGDGPGSYTIVASAAPGYKLSAPFSKSITVLPKLSSDNEACLTPVRVSVTISATDPTCDTAGSLVIPAQTGVIFSGGSNGDGPGDYTIVASAAPGYKLSAPFSQSITVLPKLSSDNEKCLTPVTVSVTISATDPTCDTAGSLVIPAQTGVIFSGGSNGDGPGDYTIVASAAPGYKLSAPFSQSITVLPQLPSDNEKCLTPVTVSVTISAVPPTCDTAGSLVIPSQTGVVFSGGSNGDGPGDYTIVASAAPGYKLTAPFSQSITVLDQLAFDSPDCVIPVTVSVTISATPPTCDTAGSLVIPAQTGVIFSGGSNGDGPGDYTIVASAAPGYTLTAPFSQSITVQPKLSIDSESCVTLVVLTDPSGSTCDVGNTATDLTSWIYVSSTGHVSYTYKETGTSGPETALAEGYNSVPAGLYTVTATADPGYTFAGGSPKSWDLTVLDPATSLDCNTLAAWDANAVKQDQVCSAGKTVSGYIQVSFITEPGFENRVHYFIGTTELTSAKTNLAPGTYTVTAAVDPAHSSDTINAPSEWTLTIAAANTVCGDLTTLALTGFTGTAGLLFAGSLIFLGGIGVYMRRRYGVKSAE